MATHGHSVADAQHLHLHRVAFEKLRCQPELLLRVMALLHRWIASDEQKPSRPWLEEWRAMLSAWPLERVAQRVLDPERGQVLRQCSPLAPVLTPQERWAALKEVAARITAGETSKKP